MYNIDSTKDSRRLRSLTNKRSYYMSFLSFWIQCCNENCRATLSPRIAWRNVSSNKNDIWPKGFPNQRKYFLTTTRKRIFQFEDYWTWNLIVV